MRPSPPGERRVNHLRQAPATALASNRTGSIYTERFHLSDADCRRETGVCKLDRDSISGTSRSVLTPLRALVRALRGAETRNQKLHHSRYFGLFLSGSRNSEGGCDSVQGARIRWSGGVCLRQRELEQRGELFVTSLDAVGLEQPLLVARGELETIGEGVHQGCIVELFEGARRDPLRAPLAAQYVVELSEGLRAQCCDGLALVGFEPVSEPFDFGSAVETISFGWALSQDAKADSYRKGRLRHLQRGL